MRSVSGLIFLLTCLLLYAHSTTATPFDRRQAGASPSPTTSPGPSASPTATQGTGFPTLSSTTPITSGPTPSNSIASGSQSRLDASPSRNVTSISTTASHGRLTSTISTTTTPIRTAINSATNGTAADGPKSLPLTPRITPALSVAGVILMVSGSAYLLIGIKNRSIQIFLSSAYLTSFSVTVLVVYVMSPPISNAIQGAYFVAAFMTGVLFGAGSLIFPEVTEGLGCILGGVCLSMWLLVLRAGGTLTGLVAKIVFVLAFGVAVWSLSFFRRTRPYGLIGATSFSGATAVVLGIDCFSRAGLKEFWVYIWNLNDNVFPINTNSYPITRGMQVEIAAIVMLFIVGVISQLKLWRVIKDRREKKEAEQRAGERRKSAMEEVMGRFLEARTDREKAGWEKIYGPQWHQVYSDNVRGSRTTLIESSANLAKDNRKSWVSVREFRGGSGTETGVEMNRLSMPRADHNPMLRSIRQSAMTVHTIVEDDETRPDASASTTDVQSANSMDGTPDHPTTMPQYNTDIVPVIPPLPFAIPNAESSNVSLVQSSVVEPTRNGSKLQLANTRESHTSILKRLSGQNDIALLRSRSEEALVSPEGHRSRGSSVAATLNDELGELDLQSIHSEVEQNSEGYNGNLMLHATPSITPTSSKRASYLGGVSQSPSALSVESDPEELERPATARPQQFLKQTNDLTVPSTVRSTSVITKDSNSGKGLTVHSKDVRGSGIPSTDVASTASLTEGALLQVPSQVSDVVTTYRTNEWAKHISVAEAPTEDRGSSVPGEADAESPVQLVEAPALVRVEELGQTATHAGPTKKSPTSSRSASGTRSAKDSSTVKRPPEVHAPPARMTLNEQKDPPNLRRSLSDQMPATAPKIIIRPPTSAGGHNSSLPPRLARSSTTPVNQVLPSTIDENSETHFPMPSPPLSPPPSAHEGNGHRTPQLTRSASNQSLPLRSASNQSLPLPALSQEIYQQALASVSDTRLSTSRHSSRQPERRASTFVPGKRDTLLADWQGSLSRENSMAAVPQASLERRRSEMILERRQSNQSRQRAEATEKYREKVEQQAMRTQDMQALHLQAMRRLQAQANRHL